MRDVGMGSTVAAGSVKPGIGQHFLLFIQSRIKQLRRIDVMRKGGMGKQEGTRAHTCHLHVNLHVRVVRLFYRY